jgi:hypothetical protein
LVADSKSPRQFAEHVPRKDLKMDSNMIIRVVAGLLFVVVLAVLIQRRRTRVK